MRLFSLASLAVASASAAAGADPGGSAAVASNRGQSLSRSERALLKQQKKAEREAKRAEKEARKRRKVEKRLKRKSRQNDSSSESFSSSSSGSADPSSSSYSEFSGAYEVSDDASYELPALPKVDPVVVSSEPDPLPIEVAITSSAGSSQETDFDQSIFVQSVVEETTTLLQTTTEIPNIPAEISDNSSSSFSNAAVNLNRYLYLFIHNFYLISITFLSGRAWH
jgi:hypothetical protein